MGAFFSDLIVHVIAGLPQILFFPSASLGISPETQGRICSTRTSIRLRYKKTNGIRLVHATSLLAAVHLLYTYFFAFSTKN